MKRHIKKFDHCKISVYIDPFSYNPGNVITWSLVQLFYSTAFIVQYSGLKTDLIIAFMKKCRIPKYTH